MTSLRRPGCRWNRRATLAVLAAGLLTACGRRAEAVAPHSAKVEVGVVTAAPIDVPLVHELQGRASAYRVAEVRARVNGVVLKRLFDEGSEVRTGQPLFQIDPAPYEAALDSAKATLTRAQANREFQRLQEARYEQLISADVVSIPGGFLPDEDQGYVYLQVQLPPGGTMERTGEVLRQVSDHLLTQEADAVESVAVIRGFNFSGRGQNSGFGFVKLKDWSLRKSPRLKARAVAGRAMAAFSRIRGAVVFAFIPPAVQELGNATGFDLQLLDRGGAGHAKLMEARNELLRLAAGSPLLAKVRPNGLEDTPDYRVDVDRKKASALGLSLGDVNRNLSRRCTRAGRSPPR